jgi:glycosyltransferase involved in cell wall biosynthesis
MRGEERTLSVIIPALNSASTIALTLSSVFSNDFPEQLYEVLVVDNGSSDETVEVAEQYPVRVYHCSKRGIGPPRNLGIKNASGDIVCLTDSDCIVEKQWLKKICDFFKKHPDADGVGGPVYPYPDSQNKIQKLTGELFVEDQLFPEKIKEVQRGSMSGVLFGSNSAYKKDAVLRAGGYCEPGGSNLELVWRLASLKRKLFFNPEIRVNHIFPAELKSIFKQQFRWGVQSTDMKRAHHVDKGAKEAIYILYFPVRRLLSLAFHKDLERELLHFFQLVSYSLGRLYGMSNIASCTPSLQESN